MSIKQYEGEVGSYSNSDSDSSDYIDDELRVYDEQTADDEPSARCLRDTVVYDADGTPSKIIEPTPPDWSSAAHVDAATKDEIVQRISVAGTAPCVIELTNDIVFSASGAININGGKTIRITSKTARRAVISGGGVSSLFYVSTGKLYLDNLELKNGVGLCQGAVSSDLIVLNNVIAHDSTASYGGLFYGYGSLFIYDSTVYNCTSNLGGAITTRQPLLIRRSTFYNNRSIAAGDNEGGGAIAAARNNSGDPTEIYDSEFYGNYCNSNGGVLCQSNFVVLKNCSFHDNKAGKRGGALVFPEASSVAQNLTITDCDFSRNTAGEEGVSNGASCGAIYISLDAVVSGSYNHILNCTFKDNVSWGNVGAMNPNTPQETILRNLTFVGNRANNGSYGALAVKTPNLEIPNCVFRYNYASVNAGAIGIMTVDGKSGSINVTGDTVFCCNRAGGNGGAIYVPYGSYNLVKIGADVVFESDKASVAHEIPPDRPQDYIDHQTFVKAKEFTEPFEYAYNNYDIFYPYGIVDDNVCVPLKNMPPCGAVCVQTNEAGYLDEVPQPPSDDCTPPGTSFCGWFSDAALTNPADIFTYFADDDALYACWKCDDEDYVFNYAKMECEPGCGVLFGGGAATDRLLVLLGLIGDMQTEYGNILALVTSELTSALICDDRQSQNRILGDILSILDRIKATANVSDETYDSIFSLLDKLKQC